MTQRDKFRKIGVISFIAAGLGIGLYETATALPQYEGKGEGFAGDVVLSVAMDGERIDSIGVVSHSETEGISDPAFNEIIPAIISEQHLNVDNIAGATYTSEAIKVAVMEAAEKSGVKFEIAEVVKEEQAVERGRGIEGTGEGYLDDIVVEVEKQGDKITNIWVVQHGDTESIANPAFEELTSMVLENQSTDIDMVAGATWTSEGFIEAVEDALENIEAMAGWNITTGTGEGYLDDIVVEVARDGEKIVDIKVVSHGDTASLAEPAFEELKRSVIENQSTGIDMVAGATWTSEGYLEAVEAASK